MEKVTAVASLIHIRVVADHSMSTPPHNKVKDLALIFWSVSLLHQDFNLSKTSWACVFLRIFSLTSIKQDVYLFRYFVWNFHSNWLLFLKVMQENKKWLFFNSVFTHYLYMSAVQMSYKDWLSLCCRAHTEMRIVHMVRERLKMHIFTQNRVKSQNAYNLH